LRTKYDHQIVEFIELKRLLEALTLARQRAGDLEDGSHMTAPGV
jgi:hypothetical protein